MKKEIKKDSKLAIFEGRKIRRLWDGKKELWYFAVMDVIQVLTQTDRPRKYWNDLKTKLKQEGSELSEKIGQLKMQAPDGKYYFTDAADTEIMLRLIQSTPSPNAEPFKLWLARGRRRRAGGPQENRNRNRKKVVTGSHYLPKKLI